MKKRLLSWLLVLTMVTSLIPSTLVTTAFAAADGVTLGASVTEKTLSTSDTSPYEITSSGTYRVTGSSTQPIIVTADAGEVILVLNGVNIQSATSPIQLQKGTLSAAKVTLVVPDGKTAQLACTSTTKAAAESADVAGKTAGINVPDGTTLTIDKISGENGTGTLTISGGYGSAGIGGNHGYGYEGTGYGTTTHSTPITDANQQGPLGFGGDGGYVNAPLKGFGGAPGRDGQSAEKSGTVNINACNINITSTAGAGIGGGQGASGENGFEGKQGYKVGDANWVNPAMGSGGGGAGGNGGRGGDCGPVTINGGTLNIKVTAPIAASGQKTSDNMHQITPKDKIQTAGIGGGPGGWGGFGAKGGDTAPANGHSPSSDYWSSGYGGAGGYGETGYVNYGGAAEAITINGGIITVQGVGIAMGSNINAADVRTQAAEQSYAYNYNYNVGKGYQGGMGAHGGKARALAAAPTGNAKISLNGGNISVSSVYDCWGANSVTKNNDRSVFSTAPTAKSNTNGLYPTVIIVKELLDETNVPDAKITVPVKVAGGSNYTYNAMTDANGKAVLWLPEGSYTLQNKSVTHAIGSIPDGTSETVTVSADAITQTEVWIGSILSLSLTPETKVYDTAVSVKADMSEVEGTISKIRWFRVSATDTQLYKNKAAVMADIESFETGYRKASDTNRALIQNPTLDNNTYSISAEENGRYWVEVTVTNGARSDVMVRDITVKNIYRSYPIQVRSYIYEGTDSSGQPILRQDTGYTNPPDKAGAPTAQTYGFAWDLNGYDAQNPNGAKLLPSDVAPYDTLILNAKTANHTWYVAEVNGKAFADTADTKDFQPIELTLDGSFFQNQYCDSANSVKDPGKYTIRYSARDGALDVVTISGVIKDAAPGTKPLYTHTRSYTDAIDNDSITAINWPEYKLVGVQVNGTDKQLDKDVDGKTTSSITITDIHGRVSGKENKIQTVTFLYEYNMTDVTINAYYDGTTTPVEGLSSYKEKMEIGKEYTPTAPAVDGHDPTGSSLQDGKFTPTGKNDVITFYYTKSSGNVTYKAVDGEGNTLWTGSGKVTKGHVPTDVTPDYGITNMTKDDTVATKYTKTADGTDYGNDNKYDGVNDITVTYTYKHITRNVTVQKIDTTKSGAGAVIETETAKPYNVGSYPTIAPANTPSGYEIVGDDSKTVYIEAGAGDLVVKFYYRPSTTADVTIKLFEADASGSKVGTEPFQTITVKVSYGQEQTINAPTITGWAVTGKTTEKVNVKNGETAPEIEFLYKPVYDTITVYAKIQGDDTSAPLSTETYQVQQGQSFKAQAPSVVNYKLADGKQRVQSLTAERIKGGTTSLTFRYVKAEADLITITVEGVVDGVATPLYSYTKDVRQSETDVEVQIFTLNGYKLDNVKMGTNTTITATDGTYKINPNGKEQTVTATYIDNMVDVTINGYLKGTTTKLFDSFTVKAEAGKAFTYAQPSLIGYDTVTPINNTIDAVKAGDSITFFYQKSSGNVTYKAADENDKNNVLAIKTETVKKNGEIVKSTDKANALFSIPYYQVKGDGDVTTNAADKTKYDGVNDVTVTYTYERIKKAVTIEKIDQATGRKIKGVANQVTEALATGETHTVTLTKVDGYTSLDSSISIFVDGTDGQTVKAYYKQSDEVFITVKQMCGGVLLNSYKVPAQYGVKQEIKAPDMPGYTKPTGTFEATPIKGNDTSMVVTLEYTLDAWEVAVKLIDAAGKDITPAGFEKTYQVKKGDGFTIAAPNVNGYRLNGKTLVVSKSADELNNEANRTITFTYDKIEDVIGDYQAKVTIKAQYNGYALADDRTQVVTKGKDATVVPDTFEGYVVSQYKLGENGTLNDAKNGVTVNVTENTDLYLIYTRPDNSVVLPGGDGKIPAPSDQDNVIVKPGDGTTIGGPKADGSVKIPDNGTGTVTRPDPDNKLNGKEDIIVPGGTTIDKDGTIHLPENGGTIGPEQKIPESLPKGYVAITYDSNNSNQEVKKEIGKAGELKVSDSLFTDPSNRSFAGWNDSGSGNGKAYAKDTTVSANITLYAVWDAQYRYSTNIIYEANDGTTNQDTQLVGHATDPVLKGKLQNSPFQVSGWTFGGWNEAANGSGTLYQPGNVLTLQNQVNKTLFAQWFKTNTDGSITVPGSDGNPNNPDTNATGNGNGTENPKRNDEGEIEIPKGGSVTLPDGSVIGMPDGGKLLPNGTVIINRPDKDGNGKTDDGTITIPGKTDPTKPDVTDKNGNEEQNKTVYTLTYTINNGENDPDVVVKAVQDDEVTAIDNPFAWTGHTFINWLKQSDSTEVAAGAKFTVNADETFHAQWIKQNTDGSIELPGKDASMTTPKDNVLVTPDKPNGTVTKQPDGSAKVEGNSGTVNRPKDPDHLDQGKENIKVPEGTIVKPDGTIILPNNGGTINPGDKIDGNNNLTGYFVVTFLKGEAENGDLNKMLVKAGNITLPAANTFTAPSGKIFTGWKTGDEIKQAGTEYTVTANVTFTAQFKKIQTGKAVVTFDFDGGTAGGKTYETRTGDPGTKLGTPPNPTRGGYTFAGWNEQINENTLFGEENSTTIYTAQWTAKTYTIHYNGSGATGNVADQTYVFNSADAKLAQNSFTLADKVFLGWSVNKDATSAMFREGEEIGDALRAILTNLDKNSESELTLYAIWKDNQVTPSEAIAIFDFAGGKDANGNTSVRKTGAADAAITITAPTREGYTFAGWDKGEPKFGATGTVTVFTAQWTADKHEVTFEVGDGTKGEMNGDASVQVDHNSSVEANKVPTITAKTGYVFIGWSDGTSVFAKEAIQNYKVTADVTFTAQYEEDSKSVVIFDYNGGKDADGKSSISMSGDANAAINSVDAPTRDGYTFAGWKNGEQDVNELKFGAAGSVTTYTAAWTADPDKTFKVNFVVDATKGDVTDTTEFDVVSGSFLTEVPTVNAKEGYTFIGWSDGKNTYFTSGVKLYTITGATTFTALFEKADNNNPNPPAKDTLTVSGNTTAKRGDKVNFKALLNGKETDNVTWTVAGGKTGTTISEAGVLTVGSSETNGTTLTITATSKSDSTLTASTILVVLVDSGNTGGGSSGGSSGGGSSSGGSSSGGGSGSGSSTTKPSQPDTKPTPGTKPNDPTQTGIANWLRTDKHTTSMTGYGNGKFGPEDSVTRAQVAQIFHRLLKDQNVAITASFSDVADDAWYAKAVNTLASLGIIKGTSEGKFDPNRAITRAEFCAIATRFAKVASTVKNPFADINEQDWYYTAVTTAASYDWVNGMSDGNFHPHDVISRAQAATIINRMLGAAADRSYVDSHVTNPYTDVSTTYWAYYQIIEASIAHDHDYDKEGVEIWTGLK